MARKPLWVWTLVAAILFLVAAVVNAWRVFADGPAGRNVIPAVAFAVGGGLLFWRVLRERSRAV